MIHRFETRHQENLEFAAGDRLPFEQLQEQRDALCTPSFLAVVESMPQPLVFFNKQRQIIHANPAALQIAEEGSLSAVIGLRMGEFLGCDHLMEGESCKDPEECQNCNSMSAIVAALGGQPAKQALRLVIHPRSQRRRQVLDVSSVPMEVGGQPYAMLMLEPLQGK